MRLALYQPDIPQNLGVLHPPWRPAWASPLDIIEPCGFPVDDRRIRRAAMDYYDLARASRGMPPGRPSGATARGGRLVLLTTTGSERLSRRRLPGRRHPAVGRESAGVPAEVHAAADLRLRIPLQAGARSLNVALAAAMVLARPFARPRDTMRSAD